MSNVADDAGVAARRRVAAVPAHRAAAEASATGLEKLAVPALQGQLTFEAGGGRHDPGDAATAGLVAIRRHIKSEKRRGGEEGVRSGRSRWSADRSTKKQEKRQK